MKKDAPCRFRVLLKSISSTRERLDKPRQVVTQCVRCWGDNEEASESSREKKEIGVFEVFKGRRSFVVFFITIYEFEELRG